MGTNPKFSPEGFCQSNGVLVGYNGISGSCNYSKIPTNLVTSNFNSQINAIFLDPVNNKNKVFYADTFVVWNTKSTQYLNRNMNNDGSLGAYSDYLRYMSVNPKPIYDKNGKLFLLENIDHVQTKKYLFSTPSLNPGIGYGLWGGQVTKVLVVEDKDNYFTGKYLFQDDYEIAIGLSADGTRNNVLLKVGDFSACINGKVKPGRWILMSF